MLILRVKQVDDILPIVFLLPVLREVVLLQAEVPLRSDSPHEKPGAFAAKAKLVQPQERHLHSVVRDRVQEGVRHPNAIRAIERWLREALRPREQSPEGAVIGQPEVQRLPHLQRSNINGLCAICSR